MKRHEHLLFILAEEGAEVAQRASKAARFGLSDVDPNKGRLASQVLKEEMIDLIAVWGMLCREGLCEPIAPMDEPAIQAKQEKVERYLEYSRMCETLENG